MAQAVTSERASLRPGDTCLRSGDTEFFAQTRRGGDNRGDAATRGCDAVVRRGELGNSEWTSGDADVESKLFWIIFFDWLDH